MSEFCLPREQLERWLRGESVSTDRLRMLQHVESCPDCREALEQLVEVAELAAGATRPVAPGGNTATHRTGPAPMPPPVGYDTEPDTEVTREFLFRPGVVEPDPPPAGPPAGRQFGRFQLLERIGVGGFGVVYRAYDTILQREVALKLPRGLAVADDDTRARFLREARAAAGLRHPHIVPVYDAGEIDEQCYLTAAYCPGETLSAWRKRQERGRVPPHAAAAIVRQLAGAVAHAHESGILHRDVKPDNVLLDLARPSEELPFTLMLTDFGLAKLIAGGATQTAGGLALGTARYMAPEQARPDHAEIGPAVDIYSLGVILYELLTGRAPIVGENDVDTLVRVATDHPPSPARFVGDLPRDLGAICLKCLEKNPADRYATARDLQADLQRFLAGESTRARPLRPWEVAFRAMRRHRAATALGLTILGSLTVLTAGLALRADELARHGRELQDLAGRLETQLHELNRSRLEAEESRRLAEQRGENLEQMLYATDIKLAARAWREGDARELHIKLKEQTPGDTGVDRRDFAWSFLSGLAHRADAEIRVSDQALYAAASAPGQDVLVVAGHDGLIRALDPVRLTTRTAVDSQQIEVNGLSFTSDGRLLATAGADGSLCVWEFPTLRPVLRIPWAHPEQAFHCVFVDRDGLLASCGLNDGEVRLWDVVSGRPAGTLAGHAGTIESLLLLPDGSTLASLGADGTVRLWDLPSRKPRHTLDGHADRVSSACWLADGQTLVTAGLDGRLCIWDMLSGQLLDTRTQVDAVQVLVNSTCATRCIAGDRAGVLTLLDRGACSGHAAPVPTGDPPASVNMWPAHTGRVYALATTTDGACISTGEDGAVRRWSTELRSPVLEWAPPGGRAIADIAEVSWSDGALALDDSGALYRVAQGATEPMLPAPIGGTHWRRMVAERDGAALLGIDGHGQLWHWSPSDLEPRRLGALPTAKPPTDLQCSPAGHEILAIDFGENAVMRMSAESGQALATLTLRDPRDVDWSRDGALAAIASLNDVVLFNPRVTDPFARIASHQAAANCLTWHPGGQFVASGGQDRIVLITDVTRRQTVTTLQGHRASVTAAVFSPDGKCLATADVQGTIKLWHTATWQFLYDLATAGETCHKLSFSPSGDRLTAQFADRVLVFGNAAQASYRSGK